MLLLKAALLGALSLGLTPLTGIEISGVPVVGLSAPAILAIFFIMFMRGDIIPGKLHKETVADRDYWRTAHGVSEEARRTSSRQVDELLGMGQTIDAIAKGIKSAARED